MKRALLVGVDSYDNFSPLSGCVNDVNALTPLLGRHEDGAPNFEVAKLTTADVRIDRSRLVRDLTAALGPGAEQVIIYFAGHGDRSSGDVVLCTQDGTQHDAGVAFSRILGMIRESSVPEVVVMLDCCFAGGAGGTPAIGGDLALIRPGVAILTASRSDQTAAEVPGGQGKFSYYLAGALDGGAADVLGMVTVAGAYAYLSESFGAWEQRPTFKSNLDRLHVIRRCVPSVPLIELRKISELFPMVNSQFQLDPSYEPDAAPAHAGHEADFAILQRYRAAKLVEPIGTEHMYYAAMQSLQCKLTPLGRHYWNLAFQARL